MGVFTHRIGHLEKLPDLHVGDLVAEGDIIGRMGNTGQSKFNHVHQDCIHGHVSHIVRLNEIEDDRVDTGRKYKSNEQQLNHFCDDSFFGIKMVITTPYLDPEYEKVFGKEHPAIDCVPIDRHKTTEHFDISWNRTKIGHILAVGFDKGGYGNYILIGFET